MGALSNLTKQEAREQIAYDTCRFVADGGLIEEIEYDPRAEIAARVGRWQRMGDLRMDDLSDELDNTETLPDDLMSFGYQWDRAAADAVRDMADEISIDNHPED